MVFRHPSRDELLAPHRQTPQLISDHVPAPATPANPTVFGVPEGEFKRVFHKGPASELSVGSLAFVCCPSEVARGDGLTFFNVILVLAKGDPAVPLCRDVVTRFAAALDSEDERCGYLEAEAASMISIREEVGDVPLAMEAILDRSDLARRMKQLVLGLSRDRSAQILLNGWLSLRFTLEDAGAHPDGPIRPYHTLLLLSSDRRVAKASLPPDSSSQLRRLIDFAQPERSFEEISVLSGIPLPHLMRLAAHLVYWKRARVVHVFTKHNVYVAAGDAPPAAGQHADDFAAAFGGAGLTLFGALSQFSVQESLRMHMRRRDEEAQKSVIDVLVWLLQRRFVTQLHTFVYFLGSARAVLADAAQRRRPHASLLRRVAPYFRGRHHVEEILWRENVSRAELEAVLAEYSDALATVQHEL